MAQVTTANQGTAWHSVSMAQRAHGIAHKEGQTSKTPEEEFLAMLQLY